jgi:hypothetical protein
MRAYVSIFRAPKAGSSLAEYEDAVALGPPPIGEGDFAGRRLYAAVADGASEAMLAGRWARNLVAAFAVAPLSADLASVLVEAAASWDDDVASYIADREASGRPIQWYEEPGLARGAFATLLGLRLIDTVRTFSVEGRFDAWALGDACLFQVRDDALCAAFPIDDPTVFSNSPDLAASRPGDLSLVTQRILHRRGAWRSGDVFYLATDALAQWFLAAVSSGEQPWKPLGDLGTVDGPDDFSSWVAERRAASELRNDDTTLLRIDVH